MKHGVLILAAVAAVTLSLFSPDLDARPVRRVVVAPPSAVYVVPGFTDLYYYRVGATDVFLRVWWTMANGVWYQAATTAALVCGSSSLRAIWTTDCHTNGTTGTTAGTGFVGTRPMVEGTMRLLQLGTMTGLRCTTIRGRQTGLHTKQQGSTAQRSCSQKPPAGC